MQQSLQAFWIPVGWGGGAPSYGLYRDVPQDRVRFLPLCPKQGI